MSIQKMVRVDYRLIHGQVVAKWIKFHPVNRIIIADDELIKDDFMSGIYKMAVPDHEVDIVKVYDLNDTLNKKDDNVMVVFKTITSAFNAYKNGVKLVELNIGAVQDQKDRKKITSGVSISSKEYEYLNELQANGVSVYIQPIPENEKITLDKIKHKF